MGISSNSARSYDRYLLVMDRVNLSQLKRNKHRIRAGGPSEASKSFQQRKNFVCFEESQDKPIEELVKATEKSPEKKEGSTRKSRSCQCKGIIKESKEASTSTNQCKCKEESLKTKSCQCKKNTLESENTLQSDKSSQTTNECQCKKGSKRSCSCLGNGADETDEDTAKTPKKKSKESAKKEEKKTKKKKSEKEKLEKKAAKKQAKEDKKADKKKKSKKETETKSSKKNKPNSSKEKSSSNKKYEQDDSTEVTEDCSCLSCDTQKSCSCCSGQESSIYSGQESTNCLCQESIDDSRQESTTSALDTKAATIFAKDCSLIPEISQQLCDLKERMDSKEKESCLQSELLQEICKKINELSTSVKILSKQCNEQRKADVVTPSKPAPNLPSSLQKKVSSTCQFCRDKKLPILNDLKCELLDVLGERNFSDVVLTVLLRADNVYHVNIRDLNNGSVLGCLLVNDAAIKDAIKFGLFKQILTFFVIDVRNTLKPRESVFGITFEYIHEQRQTGGALLSDCNEDKQRSLPRKDFLAEVLGLATNQLDAIFCLTHATKVENVRIRFLGQHQKLNQQQTLPKTTNCNKEKQRETLKLKKCETLTEIVQTKCEKNGFLNRIETLFEIAKSDSNLVLTDYELDYPIEEIEVTSLLDMGHQSPR